MATISMNKKEIEALYFLIESQEENLDICTDEEYTKTALNHVSTLTNLIQKYFSSKKKQMIYNIVNQAKNENR